MEVDRNLGTDGSPYPSSYELVTFPCQELFPGFLKKKNITVIQATLRNEQQCEFDVLGDTVQPMGTAFPRHQSILIRHKMSPQKEKSLLMLRSSKAESQASPIRWAWAQIPLPAAFLDHNTLHKLLSPPDRGSLQACIRGKCRKLPGEAGNPCQAGQSRHTVDSLNRPSM